MSKLPIPHAQLHYADPAINDEAQTLPIGRFVDRIHHPTLGCPALLTPDQSLEVLLSLPEGADPRACVVTLVDRHGETGEYALKAVGSPVSLGKGPAGKDGRRELWQLSFDIAGKAFRLYDLRLQWEGKEETQPNAVRLYERITGDEKVVFCGDAQYHVDNEVCLERFIERINRLDDIAWVALIGDVCDNGVRGEMNVLKLALTAKPSPVHSYYAAEYARTAGKLLPRLNKPIVLVPGNHDGMVAYEDYERGESTNAYLGPDPKNTVAYDGLHHFRRSFGPLFHAFTWHRTRYLCTNTFELDRHERLGYHAVVANWGGWMRDEQLGWIESELKTATAADMHKVMLAHHDPRGGCLGKALGYYSEMRPYEFDKVYDVVVAYLRYLANHARTWQEEWMVRTNQSLADHPVKRLLETLVEHRTWAVIMGHDNENWVETYLQGDTVFKSDPEVRTYPASDEDPVDPKLVRAAADLLADRDLEALAQQLAECNEAEASVVIGKALERLDAERHFDAAASYAPAEVENWRIRAQAPIHFAHVDDVGAYKYQKEAHFSHYGYVIAQLSEGRPVNLQRFDLTQSATEGPVVDLLAATE